ncbi:IS3 family transposase, partial [Tsukamurella sp. DT100]
MAFIDQMLASGHAVESIHQALQASGLKVAARTLRAWCASSQKISERVVSDAIVENTIRQLAFTTAPDGTKQLAPEGLYGRRKMLAAARRRLPGAGFGAVDRAMRSLGLSGVVRGKAPRTTIPDSRASRAADLLNRDFTAPAPDRVWVSDFTYVRTHTSFTYVAFVVDLLLAADRRLEHLHPPR